MKKQFWHIVFIAAVILLVSLMLCACEKPTDVIEPAQSEANNNDAPVESEVPEEPDEPTATDEPAATRVPSPTEFTEGPLTYEAVPFDAEYLCDMNADGTDETILITTTAPDEYDYNYTVIIRSADGAEQYVDMDDTIENCYEGYAIMLFNSNEGERPALLVCVWQDSDDPTTIAYRVDENSGEVEDFRSYCSFVSPESEARPVNRGLLTLAQRTELMGTCFVYGDYVITGDGYVLVSDDYEYPANNLAIAVISELPVTIVDGDQTYEFKLGPSNTVLPISTDLETYVYVLLSTGDMAYVYYDGSEYPFNIDGQPQDHYLDVLYCD